MPPSSTNHNSTVRARRSGARWWSATHTAGRPLRARSRSPALRPRHRGSCAASVPRSWWSPLADIEHLFYNPRCGRPTATSPAERRSIASGTCRSPGRSTRTWAARTAAPSASCAPSSGSPIARRTPATGPRSGSRPTSSRSSPASLPAARGVASRSPSGPRPIPYQPAEGRFRLTRGAIVALGESRTPFGLITRGPMVVRDVDVLADRSLRAKVGVTFSIPTVDDASGAGPSPGPRRPASACGRSGP